jgi:hypothetical protein
MLANVCHKFQPDESSRSLLWTKQVVSQDTSSAYSNLLEVISPHAAFVRHLSVGERITRSQAAMSCLWRDIASPSTATTYQTDLREGAQGVHGHPAPGEAAVERVL